MNVSHPQNASFISLVDALYESNFSTSLTQLPTDEELASLKPSELVSASLLARQQQVEDLVFWNTL